jgi:hypothetical protein
MQYQPRRVNRFMGSRFAAVVNRTDAIPFGCGYDSCSSVFDSTRVAKAGVRLRAFEFAFVLASVPADLSQTPRDPESRGLLMA